MYRLNSYAKRFLQQAYSNRRLLFRNVHNAKDNDAPVKFSTSEAYLWKAEYTRRGIQKKSEAAWFEAYVVLASVSVFLLYFCVFREENDLDELLQKSLYDRIEGLEESQLRATLEYNLEHGKDTKKIVERLKEIEALK